MVNLTDPLTFTNNFDRPFSCSQNVSNPGD